MDLTGLFYFFTSSTVDTVLPTVAKQNRWKLSFHACKSISVTLVTVTELQVADYSFIKDPLTKASPLMRKQHIEIRKSSSERPLFEKMHGEQYSNSVYLFSSMSHF